MHVAVVESNTNRNFILNVSLSTTVTEQINTVSAHGHFRLSFKLCKDSLFTAYFKIM
jgi:hypothetical protein